MDIKLRKEFLADVESAVVSAERKHPKICDDFVTIDLKELQPQLLAQRMVNDQLEKTNDSQWFLVATEELLEAAEVFVLKDYKQCIKELAQIAAVAVRGMEFVYRLTPEAKASAKFKGGAND